jgi:aminoglycoside 3-N-acetyltransferase
MDLREMPDRIGVRPGMTVLLMADVTRLAWQMRRAGGRFDPTGLLDAFLAALGPAGTLLIPTYNHDLREEEPYDIRRTPPITGALGVAALKHPAFRRTRHPLHSFAVAGGAAQTYLALDDASSFSSSSPFALLREHHAVLVTIDLSLNDAFTYAHHVEELEGVRYRRWRDLPIRYTDANGHEARRVFRRFAKRSGHGNAFTAMEPVLERSGALVRHKLEEHQGMMVDLAAAHELVVADIRENKARNIHWFSWNVWLRDMVRRSLPSPSPSRSARLLNDPDVGAL